MKNDELTVNEETSFVDEQEEFISEDVEGLTFLNDEIAGFEKTTQDKNNSKKFLFLANEITALFFTVIVVVAAIIFIVFSSVFKTEESDLSIKRFTEKNEYSMKIELNSAPKVRFELIPGIGSSMAEKIDNYRKNVKKFDSIEELIKIKGIGKTTVAKMKPYVYIADPELKNIEKHQ